jgi:predicted nucleotidyltransferase
MNESVLDIPQNNLDSSMWIQNNGKYIPSDEAKEKINSVIKWLMEKTAVNSFKLHITGSITSNQYSKDSDIDLHFISDLVSEENVDEINKKLREMFENDFKQNYDYMIGSHPIEIYFQVNEF